MHSGNKNTVITIEYYTPQNPRTISLLGLETIVNHYLIREKFKSDKPNIEKLESVSKYYSSEMKKKGQKIDYQLEQDLIVNNIEYLNKEQYKSATQDLNHNLATNFSSHYWEEYLSFIPLSIEHKLYTDMELIKK